MSLRINIIIAFMIILSGSLYASGSINLSSEFYSYEADTLSHNRFYQSLRADYTFYKKNFKQISFHTYGKWSTDFSDQFDNDPLLNIYSAYFKFSKVIPKTTFNFGRQFVYNSSGSTLIDGLMFRTNKFSKLSFQFFAGSNVSRLKPDEIQKVAENLVLGSRFSYTSNSIYKFGLNWFYQKDLDEAASHRLGADINFKPNHQWNFYSRLTYNHLSYSLSDILFRTSFRKSDWYVTSEFKYREPSVNPNSVFAIIDFQKYKRLHLSIQKSINKKYALITQVYYAIYDTENSLNGSIGFRMPHASLSYHFQSGRSESNGISASINYPIKKDLIVYGVANLNRYKIQTGYDDLSDAYTTALGLTKRFNHDWQIKTEWQYLKNANENYSSRIYLKINKGISLK